MKTSTAAAKSEKPEMKNWILQYAQQSSSDDDDDIRDTGGPGADTTFDPVGFIIMSFDKKTEFNPMLKFSENFSKNN